MSAPEDQAARKEPNELPSYSLEDEHDPVGWRKWLRGRRLALVVALSALVAAAVLGAKPLYREAKARRALSIAAQAGEALERGDAQETSRLLRQAALMAFDDKRVAALVTLHAARAGDQASVADLGKKLTAGDATPEETLVYAESSLRAGRLPDAVRAQNALEEDDLSVADAARSVILRSDLLQAQGKAEEAAAALRAALQVNPGVSSDGIRIALSGLLLKEQQTGSSAEARKLLEEAAGNPGEQGVAALRLLCASLAGITPEARRDFEQAAERLRSHPASRSEDEIFLARLSASADPSRIAEISGELVERLQRPQSSPIEVRAAAARWLVGQSRLKEVLELVSDEEAATHAGALMARLDALSGLEDWERTSALVEKNRGGTLPDTLYHLFRARIFLSRGVNAAGEEEKRELRQLLPFAELPHVLFVARYAEVVGWKPEALAAWRALAVDEAARPEALRGQLRNLPANAPAKEGVTLTNELLSLRPDDPSARISSAYFRLLANEDTVSAAGLAEEFLAAEPGSEDFRRVAALARLRTGKAAEGLAIWPGDGGENRWRALHVALLRESGQTKAADAAAAAIDVDSLAPEETALVRGEAPQSR